MLPIQSYEPEKITWFSKKGQNTSKMANDVNENLIIRFSISESPTAEVSSSNLKNVEFRISFEPISNPSWFLAISLV